MQFKEKRHQMVMDEKKPILSIVAAEIASWEVINIFWDK